MKKILTALLTILFVPCFVFAQIIPSKIYACSPENIRSSEIKEGKSLSFNAIDTYALTDTINIERGAIVQVKVKEYVSPKVGKRNGYAKVALTHYSVPSKENETISIADKHIEGTLKLSTPKDKKEIAKHVGVTVVGQALKFPGFSQAIAVSKGLINPNPNQTRIESAGNNLYESTPLTYTEKGKDLKIEKDSIVVISIKNE